MPDHTTTEASYLAAHQERIRELEAELEANEEELQGWEEDFNQLKARADALEKERDEARSLAKRIAEPDSHIYFDLNESNKALSREVGRLREAVQSPWPSADVRDKLIEAAALLLGRCDYDGDGWELIAAARDAAVQHRAALTPEETP